MKKVEVIFRLFALLITKVRDGIDSLVTQQRRFTSLWPYLGLAMASFVSLIWTQGKLIYFLNENLPMNPSIDMWLYLQPWVTIYGHGGPYNALDLFIYSIPFYILSRIGLDLTQSLEIIFYTILLISGISFYKLCSVLLPDNYSFNVRFASFAGAIFYMNNLYVMEALLANAYLEWEAYAVIPLFIFVSLRIIRGSGSIALKSSYFIILAACSIVIGNLSEPYPPVIAIFLLSIFTIVIFSAWNYKASLRGKIRFLRLSLPLLVLIAVNAFQIPVFLNQAKADASIFSGSQMYWVFYNLRAVGSAYPISYALRWPILTQPGNSDFGSMYNFPVTASYLSITYLFVSLVVPLLVYLPVLFTKRNLASTGIIYFAALFVALFTETIIATYSGPFAVLIPVIFKPGSLFNGLQDPLLAVGWLTTLCVSICISFGFLFILARTHRHYSWEKVRLLPFLRRRSTNRVLAVAILIVLLLSQYQAWTMDAAPAFNGITSRVTFPSSYAELEEFLHQNSNNSLVLGLPVAGGLEALNFSPGNVMWASDPIPLTIGKSTLMDGSDAITVNDQNLYYNIIYNVITYDGNTRNFTNLLDAMNVRYVVLQTNMVSNVPGGPAPFNVNLIQHFLSIQNNITLIKKFGPYFVYQNTGLSSFSWLGKPYYFNPTFETPINSMTVNKTFLESFSNEDFFDTVNGTNIVFGGSYFSNGSLTEYVNYTTRLKIGNVYNAFSTTPLDLNSTDYNNVILNYSSNSPNTTIFLQLFSGPVTSQNITGTWPYIYSSEFLNPRSNAIPPPSEGNKTVVFEIPQDYRGNRIESMRLFIQFTPQPNQNYSVTFHNITFAQYVSNQQWPLLFLDNQQFNSPIISSLAFNDSVSYSDHIVDVSVTKISSTRFSARLTNVSRGNILVFSESFSPYWILETPSGSYINSTHLIIDSYANGWILNESGNFSILFIYNSPSRHILEYVILAGLMSLLLFLIYILFEYRNANCSRNGT